MSEGDKAQLSATARIEVRFNDCDPMGVVWHGNYIKYFEEGREAFGKKYNFDYLEFFRKGVLTPIVHVDANYRKPLRYKDVALVETTFHFTDAAKIIFEYKIRNEATGEIACSGSSIQVFVKEGSMELLLTRPDFINDWLQEVGLI